MESSTIDVDQTLNAPQQEPLSQAVVNAVAEAADVDQTELPPLFHTIDPDALDALFDSKATPVDGYASGTVTFSYYGYDVRVTAEGTVDVERHPER